jgi:hypothetical protein
MCYRINDVERPRMEIVNPQGIEIPERGFLYYHITGSWEWSFHSPDPSSPSGLSCFSLVPVSIPS